VSNHSSNESRTSFQGAPNLSFNIRTLTPPNNTSRQASLDPSSVFASACNSPVGEPGPVSSRFRSISHSSTINTNKTSNINRSKRFAQLPIITHTCPTPVHTPMGSMRGPPFGANYRYDTKYLHASKSGASHLIRFPRKFSLDSTNDRFQVFQLSQLY
jgi:hypothetical protein